MNFVRTFNLSRLFHKFLKPKNIGVEKLPTLVTLLFEHGFIDLLQADDFQTERYIELEKLTDRKNRNELFKIVQSLKDT